MTTSIPQERPKNAPVKATTKARVAKRRPHAAPTNTKPARKAAQAKKPSPARGGTKTAKILDLLKRPAGATLKELMKTTGWQAHSVRGFLSGTLGKKMGTPVESFKSDGGERAYRLSSK
ncbi:MAG: hypothetical protein JWO19_3342 [Bryobacterales bacterium]|nr:hypothetical protein [Bryobacterales bacterium]